LKLSKVRNVEAIMKPSTGAFLCLSAATNELVRLDKPRPRHLAPFQFFTQNLSSRNPKTDKAPSQKVSKREQLNHEASQRHSQQRLFRTQSISKGAMFDMYRLMTSQKHSFGWRLGRLKFAIKNAARGMIRRETRGLENIWIQSQNEIPARPAFKHGSLQKLVSRLYFNCFLT
jgi:hypothetical protein